LILLIFGDEVLHVRLGFGEPARRRRERRQRELEEDRVRDGDALHFVHSFAGVPVEEGLATDCGDSSVSRRGGGKERRRRRRTHRREGFANAAEELLDRGGVPNEGDSLRR
jgi:hypothetical protein